MNGRIDKDMPSDLYDFFKAHQLSKKNTGVLPKNTNPNPVRMHAHSTRAQVSTRLKPVAHG